MQNEMGNLSRFRLITVLGQIEQEKGRLKMFIR